MITGCNHDLHNWWYITFIAQYISLVKKLAKWILVPGIVIPIELTKKIYIYHKIYNKSAISTAWLTWKVCYIGVCDIRSDERQFGENHLYICFKQNPYMPFQSVVLTVQVVITFMYPVPLSLQRTKFNPSWINNYIHYKAWHVITYPFPNFNDASVWGMDNLMAYCKTEVTPVR